MRLQPAPFGKETVNLCNAIADLPFDESGLDCLAAILDNSEAFISATLENGDKSHGVCIGGQITEKVCLPAIITGSGK